MSEKIVQLNEEVIKGQLKELVRGSVEETLNELLEQEAEQLTQAARYERSEARRGYRSGHYDRNLTTTSGDVTLHVPRLKGVPFETAIIERYRRRESSVEEALIEMYLAGVSVRRVEDITEALWGTKVSPSTISELNKKAYVHIEDWRNRPLQGGKYPYVYVDGIYLRRNWGGEYENVAILVAIAVNEDGYREVLGAAEGMKEDKASWVSFFQWLKGRGLDGVKLIVGDKCLGMLEAVGEVLSSTLISASMNTTDFNIAPSPFSFIVTLLFCTSSACTFLCSVPLPSNRHPARRASRHPYHSQTVHHRQKAQTHRQPILLHPSRLCSHMSAVLAVQILHLRRAESLPHIRVRRQVWRKPRAVSDSVRPPHNCGSSAGIDRTFFPVPSMTASFHCAAVLSFLQTSY